MSNSALRYNVSEQEIIEWVTEYLDRSRAELKVRDIKEISPNTWAERYRHLSNVIEERLKMKGITLLNNPILYLKALDAADREYNRQTGADVFPY